jgi:hypothetical protein
MDGCRFRHHDVPRSWFIQRSAEGSQRDHPVTVGADQAKTVLLVRGMGEGGTVPGEVFPVTMCEAS